MIWTPTSVTRSTSPCTTVQRAVPMAFFAAEEAAEVRDYAERQADRPSESFGSLADKLRGALSRKN